MRYHVDETTKAAQLAEGWRNLRHPLLMLETAELWLRNSPKPESGYTWQAAAEAGREASALFAALGVATFAMLGGRMFGAMGAWLCGIFVLASPQLYTLAHFTKEDTALLGTLGLQLLVLDWAIGRIRVRDPHAGWGFPVTVLALSCAVAASAKYVGALSALWSLPFLVLYFRNRRELWAVLTVFVGVFLFGFLWINLRILVSPERFVAMLTEESAYLIGGHEGIAHRSPLGYYLALPFRHLGWMMLLAGLVGMFALVRRGRAMPVGVLIVGLILGGLILLSLSAKVAETYFLPIEILLRFCAGAAVVAVGKWVADALRRYLRVDGMQTVAGLLVMCALAWGILLADYGQLWHRWKLFQFSQQDDLRVWVVENLPKDAVILQDRRVALPSENLDVLARIGDEPIPQKVISLRYAADHVTKAEELQSFRARGITHVAVARPDYNRFLGGHAVPSRGEEASFREARRFYWMLQYRAERVWHAKPGDNMYLHPGISLYRLRD